MCYFLAQEERSLLVDFLFLEAEGGQDNDITNENCHVILCQYYLFLFLLAGLTHSR